MNPRHLLPSVLLVIAVAAPHPCRAASGTWTVAYLGVEESTGRKGRADYYTVTLAARELAAYMSQVLGQTVTVSPWAQAEGERIILITDETHAPADVAQRLAGRRRDAFLIESPRQVDGRDVCLLVSRDQQGYMFPVYYFLRTYMGVDWIGPAPVGQIVSSQPDWQLPEGIDVQEDPDYEHRSWSQPALDPRRWLVDGRRLQFHHNLHKVFDVRKYRDRPELFPFYEGQRHVPDTENRRSRIAAWQPCVTNPAVVDIATEYGTDFLSERPEMASFSLSINDGGVGYCMCDVCLAQDAAGAWDYGNVRLSDRFFRFYNQVISRVADVHPGAYLAVLGYNRLKTPPVETPIHPRIVVYNCVDNTNPEPDMVKRQTAWKAAGAIPAIYTRVYDGGFLTVRHYPHALADLVRHTHRLGGFGFYSESFTNWAAGGPKMYVLAQLLWDTSTDVDALLDRYMQLSFGPTAAPHVRAYFDRWEAIWERGDPAQRYNVTRDNKAASQLDELTWDDLQVMDELLAAARQEPATTEQAQRLGYVTTYYRWIQPNAAQYLLAREIGDPQWRRSRLRPVILDAAERGAGLTADFDRIWRQSISVDTTGWLMSKRVEGRVDAYWETTVARVRGDVQLRFSTAVDDAFAEITSRLLRDGSTEQAVTFWQSQAQTRPAIRPWAATQVHLLQSGPGPNLLTNAGFERGQLDGEHLSLDGWEVGADWQGIPVRVVWREASGRDGGRTLAFGKGRIGQMATTVPLEPQARYRLSIWYRTTHEHTRVFLWGLPDVRLRLPVTDGQWRRWETTFTAVDSVATLRFEVPSQDEGEWVLFDDAELVRIDGA